MSCLSMRVGARAKSVSGRQKMARTRERAEILTRTSSWFSSSSQSPGQRKAQPPIEP
jgi:hypothetical protein